MWMRKAEGEHPDRESRQQLRGHDPGNTARPQEAQVAAHKGSILSAQRRASWPGSRPQGVHNSANLCTAVDDTPTRCWAVGMSDARYIVIGLRGTARRAAPEQAIRVPRSRWGRNAGERSEKFGAQWPSQSSSATASASRTTRTRSTSRSSAPAPGSTRTSPGSPRSPASSSSPSSTASPPSSSTRPSSRSPCRTSKTTLRSTPSPPACCSRPSTSACSATTRPTTS